MSWYYNYYAGYRKDGKYYVIGPFDNNGTLRNLLWYSRSCDESDFDKNFDKLPADALADEAKPHFTWKEWDGTDYTDDVYACDLDKLPEGELIKRGFFLIEDVSAYLADGNSWDRFYDSVKPEVYAAMAANEIKFGKPGPQKDEEGFTYTPKSASDYMYFAYNDFWSEQGIAWRIRDKFEMFIPAVPEGAIPVVLMTQG